VLPGEGGWAALAVVDSCKAGNLAVVVARPSSAITARIHQGFGSASISCGSRSRVLNTNADTNPDLDATRIQGLIFNSEKPKKCVYFFQIFLKI